VEVVDQDQIGDTDPIEHVVHLIIVKCCFSLPLGKVWR
jgi:hypothetical protein